MLEYKLERTRESLIAPCPAVLRRLAWLPYWRVRKYSLWSHIRMTKKLLHVLRRCAVGQQIAGEGVAKLMEMKTLHAVHSFLCYLTHIGNRCRRLIPAILPHTDKADRLIALWRML